MNTRPRQFTTIVCDVCGTTVKRQPDARRMQRYCSRSCALSMRPRRRTPLAERFWSKVNVGGLYDCWEWTGARSPQGYGRIWVADQHEKVPAHRVSLMWHLGLDSLPAEMDACHHCDNPPCVNPAHLFIGTRAENIADCIAKGRFVMGDRANGVKLTSAQIPLIRQQLAAGLTRPHIAKQFGVSRAAIRMIEIGKNWRHITEAA